MDGSNKRSISKMSVRPRNEPHWYNLLCRSEDRHYPDGGNSDDGFDVAIAKKKLNPKIRRETRSLLDDYPVETLTSHLLVNIVRPDKKRLFGVFKSHLEFARYQAKLDPDKRWLQNK